MRTVGTIALLSVIGISVIAHADTSDVTWQNQVVVEKNGDRCADDPNCFNRYHPAIQPAARARPGDFIRLRNAGRA
jgi:formamidase